MAITNESIRSRSFVSSREIWLIFPERKEKSGGSGKVKWKAERKVKLGGGEIPRSIDRHYSLPINCKGRDIYIYVYVYTWFEAGPRKKSNNSLLYRPSLRYIAAIKLTLRFVKPDAKFRENFLSSLLPLIILQLYKQNIGCFRIPRVYPLEKKEKF